MNATTATSTTERHARAYFDLEPRVRDLALMADLARSHAVDAFGSIHPNETEERKRERSIALFAVIHLEEMVGDLEKAYDAGFHSAGEPAA
jgi:hypothetical protein